MILGCLRPKYFFLVYQALPTQTDTTTVAFIYKITYRTSGNLCLQGTARQLELKIQFLFCSEKHPC